MKISEKGQLFLLDDNGKVKKSIIKCFTSTPEIWNIVITNNNGTVIQRCCMTKRVFNWSFVNNKLLYYFVTHEDQNTFYEQPMQTSNCNFYI